MKQIFALLVIAIPVASIGFAQSGTPSSKATAAISTMVGCKVANATTLGTAPMTCTDVFSGITVNVDPDGFVDVMKSTVKVSNSQSLFVSPSLVTGLYTATTVKTKPGGGASTATGEGGVYLRAVLVDSLGNVIKAQPIASCANTVLGCKEVGTNGFGVVLDSRIQTLTQDISQCLVLDSTGATTGNTCSFDLTTSLALTTTSAHTFNFIFPNVGVGVYTIKIQAAVDANATVGGSGTAVGAAAFGLGSLTVESVRLVHDFSF